jgi:hypothetical protein
MEKIDWTKPIENDQGPCTYLGEIKRTRDIVSFVIKSNCRNDPSRETVIIVNRYGIDEYNIKDFKVRNAEPEKVCYFAFKPDGYSTAATTVSCPTLNKEELKSYDYTHAIKITTKGNKIISIEPITL